MKDQKTKFLFNRIYWVKGLSEELTLVPVFVDARSRVSFVKSEASGKHLR